MRDLAQAVIDAGGTPVRDGATVAAIEIELAALSRATPIGAAFWAMRLRYPDAPRIAFLARWRRSRRRRAGIGVTRILLRWTPLGLDALVDGRAVAFPPILQEP